jgi:hypothetical protein
MIMEIYCIHSLRQRLQQKKPKKKPPKKANKQTHSTMTDKSIIIASHHQDDNKALISAVSISCVVRLRPSLRCQSIVSAKRAQ